MASVSQVQAYLAYWFQLGKPVVFNNGKSECLPVPIFQGNQFSQNFEQCWQQVMQAPAKCHLQGTDQTVEDLLATEWEVVACARCEMPVPMQVRMVNSSVCPCSDLPSWPNDELPQPRMGVDSQDRLKSMRDRLSNSQSI